jgi:hypothetical protein
MLKSIRISITGLFIILIGCNNPSSQKPAFSHEKAIEKASRFEKDGWIFVHLEGSPGEIGYQHGYLLANEILDMRGAIINSDEKMTGKSWNFFREEAFRLHWTKTPEEYQKEIDGIVKGVNAKISLP